MEISTSGGLLRFLSVHGACFTAMAKVADTGSESGKCLAEMVDCINRDLRGLGASVSDVAVPELGDSDPLALDYIVEGSRLGSKVLRRRWASSTDPQVLAANAYFSLRPEGRRWREVCEELSQLSPGGERAMKITSDTQELFDMFCRVSQMQGVTTNQALEASL